MGSWGSGVFDNDAARDHLFDLMQELADEVSESLAESEFAANSDADPKLVQLTVENLLAKVLPNIEIICVLHESFTGGYLPEPNEIVDWQQRYEKLIEPAASAGKIPIDRQAVIQRTFDRLIALCRQCWDEDQSSA